jgi:hypothetical protein
VRKDSSESSYSFDSDEKEENEIKNILKENDDREIDNEYDLPKLSRNIYILKTREETAEITPLHVAI